MNKVQLLEKLFRRKFMMEKRLMELMAERNNARMAETADIEERHLKARISITEDEIEFLEDLINPIVEG